MTLKVYIFILSQFLLIGKISSGGDSGCEDECDQVNPLSDQFSSRLDPLDDDLTDARTVIIGVLGDSVYQQARSLAVQLRNAETQEERDNFKTLLAEITYDPNNGENKKAMEEAISGIQDKIDELSVIAAALGNLKKADCSQCDLVQAILDQAFIFININQFELYYLQDIVEYTTPI